MARGNQSALFSPLSSVPTLAWGLPHQQTHVTAPVSETLLACLWGNRLCKCKASPVPASPSALGCSTACSSVVGRHLRPSVCSQGSRGQLIPEPLKLWHVCLQQLCCCVQLGRHKRYQAVMHIQQHCGKQDPCCSQRLWKSSTPPFTGGSACSSAASRHLNDSSSSTGQSPVPSGPAAAAATTSCCCLQLSEPMLARAAAATALAAAEAAAVGDSSIDSPPCPWRQAGVDLQCCWTTYG